MSQAISGAILGLWILTTSLCSAQVSTFPSPPPLPSPSSSSTDNGAPTSSVVQPAAPAAGSPGATASPAPLISPSTSVEPTESAAAPITAATLSSMDALDDKVTLQPGDRISVRVLEDQDEAVPRIVTDTGEVDFPYVGRVKVQGRTCQQVAVELKGLYEVNYYKRATVIVGIDVIAATPPSEPVHNMVWIVGQVRQVGPQELIRTQPLTVSQAILRAGGFGDFADQRKVRLLHRGAHPSVAASGNFPPISDDSNTGQIIDVKAVFDGKSNVDPVVTTNDLIVVPKRLVNF